MGSALVIVKISRGPIVSFGAFPFWESTRAFGGDVGPASSRRITSSLSILDWILRESRSKIEPPRYGRGGGRSMTMRRLDTPVAGRSCGDCNLGCKLPYIESPELSKPAGVWCKHCKPGKGCAIYDTRPSGCRNFFCFWMTRPELGNEWRPTISKLVVCLDSDGHRLAILVDPGSPMRWHDEPYYSQLKTWASVASDNDAQVVVYIKNRAIVVLPNKDVDLGIVAPEDSIIVSELNRPAGSPRDWDASVRHAGDVSPER